MLEQREDLNKLDEDFITICSNYFLYQDKELILPLIEKLAENGQVDAIQLWYLLKNPESENAEIESIVDAFDTSDNYNNILSQAIREYAKNRDQIDNLEKSILEFNKKDVEDNDSYSFRRKNELIRYLSSTSYAKLSKLALKQATQLFEETNSPIVGEKCLEMSTSVPNLFGHKISDKTTNEIREALMDSYNNYPNDPAVCFSFAKYLNYFGQSENIPMNNQLAMDLFSELSSRELHTFLAEPQETTAETKEPAPKTQSEKL